MGNELIKHDDLAPLLSAQERTIVLAARENKIRDVKPIEIANKVTELITAALVALGHTKNEILDRAKLEKAIVNDLQNSFTTLTLKEVENAFYLGSRGHFKNKPDEVIFMSVSIVYNWLVKYQLEIKRAAMKKQYEFETLQQTIMNENERQNKIKEARDLNIEAVKEGYGQFINGHEIYDPLNVVYDFLDSEGLINLSIDRKKEIYKTVKEQYRARHTKAATIGDHALNKKILQEMEKGSDKIDSILKMLSKQAALKVVFGDIKELGMTIDEFLTK